MSSFTRWLTGILLVLGTVFMAVVPADAFAEAPRQQLAPVPSKVTVEVMVVQATNKHSKVDDELRPVMQSLRHLRFTGFTVLSTNKLVIGERSDGSINVVGGRRLKVDLLEVDDTQAKLRFQLMKGDKKVMDTTVSIRRNRTFIVAGPKHDDGVLILPLTVRY